MVSSALVARRGLAAATLSCLLAACTQGPPDMMLIHHDFSGNGAIDFAGADLYGVDLFGFPPDDMGDQGGPDMSRTTWMDLSFGTNTLWSVWSNGTSVWAVGDAGTILKGNGTGAFAADPATKPNTTTNLYSIAGVGLGPPTNPLYTAGAAGAIWSYGSTPAPNGAWAALPGTGAMSFSYVWIAPDGQAFAIGKGNVAKRQNGTTWSDIAGLDADAFGLWGVKTAGGYTVYACGAAQGGVGRVWKYTGTSFVVENTGQPNALYAIYGFADNDIYAVGDKGTIIHSTGNGSWTTQTAGVATAIEAIGGASADEVYAVGDNGVVLHKYGASLTSWTKETLASATENRNFFGVWANAARVWVVGQPLTAGGLAPILMK